MKKIFIFCLAARMIFLPICAAVAQEVSQIDFIGEDEETFTFDKAAVAKGLHFVSRDKMFTLVITPKLLNADTAVAIQSYKTDGLVFPVGWQVVSKIYEFSFASANGVNYQQSTIMQISSESDIMNVKRIFIWDEKNNEWREMASTTLNSKTVRAKVSLNGGKFVLLQSEKIMELGAASWYKYKNCDCAASPDYPKGTRVRVTNLDNGKSLVVKINDWGPERDKHPNRVIDLDKTAFKKLGSLSRGLLKNVRVELVKN
jgi:hypothetical protein